MKKCSICRCEKPLEDFHVGRASCKVCREAYMSKWRDNNRAKMKKTKNNWKKRNPDKVKSSSLKSDYGIDLDKYKQLLLSQNNSCAICKRNQTEFKKALSVDHCHKTGYIRGLLCLKCNRSLGLLEDNPSLFRNAASYLEQSYEKVQIKNKPTAKSDETA